MPTFGRSFFGEAFDGLALAPAYELTWEAIASYVRTNLNAHAEIRVEKSSVMPPDQWGMKSSVGLKVANAHWRTGYADGKGFHVIDYGDYWTAHWDNIDLQKDPVGHFYADTPEIAWPVTAFVVGGLALWLGSRGK